jgi:hypothetical protein
MEHGGEAEATGSPARHAGRDRQAHRRDAVAPGGGHLINELYLPQLGHSPILQDLRIEELEKKAASMAKQIEDLGKKVVAMAAKIEELQKRVEAKPLKP